MSGPTDIEIRDWDKSDLAPVAVIAAKAWPESSRHLSAQFIRDLTHWYWLWSNWAKTVTHEERPIGALMGRIERDFGRRQRMKANLFALKGLFSLVLGRHGRPQHLWKFVGTLIKDELAIDKLQPTVDGEVTLLMLDEAYHGQGIGRKLMEAFVAKARASGARKLNLVTDEDSNWRFYERLGWKRIADFPLTFDAYLVGHDVTGYIYELELE